LQNLCFDIVSRDYILKVNFLYFFAKTNNPYLKRLPAKLRRGFVDQVLWTILAANAAILFVSHHIITCSQILDVVAILAVMMSGVMLYAPLVFLFLYPIGRLFEKTFHSAAHRFSSPSDSCA